MARVIVNPLQPSIGNDKLLMQQVARVRVEDEDALKDDQIDKDGTSLTDIENRPHSALQDILEVNPSSANTDRDKHVSDNDLKLAADHRSAEADVHGANGDLIGVNDTATTLVAGVVLQSVTQVDAVASSVSVTSPNAATQTAAYVQADVQSIATLANELKSDVNTLVSDVNATVTVINDLIDKLQTAGIMD